LTYILSLMRSHHNEHGDALPKLEITAMKHVAFILDSFIYYVRSKQQCRSNSRISSGVIVKKEPADMNEMKSSQGEDKIPSR